jgi:His-Xaa-Ser system radical SAM maturase HxsC
MIPLRIGIEPLPVHGDFVFRLRMTEDLDDFSKLGRDAVFISQDAGLAEFDASGISLRMKVPDASDLDGDVILVRSGSKTAHRLIRRQSRHNTFVVTEQCDQKCVMCSQPPKPYHLDLFAPFAEALELAPKGATIGISGGEPLLHKERLFSMLAKARLDRPDLRFHVLTNAQHISEADIATIEGLGSDAVLWGVPLYSSDADIHDRIVEKQGAFELLRVGLSRLARAGARLELRTVVMNSNIVGFEALAAYISRHLNFIDVWAVMQMENIGYARKNWAKEFFDNSLTFEPLADALDIAVGRGVNVSLYNFPSCSVPKPYRRFCVDSISDWKNKHFPVCADCSLRSSCAGFFEWTPLAGGFARLEAQ